LTPALSSVEHAMPQWSLHREEAPASHSLIIPSTLFDLAPWAMCPVGRIGLNVRVVPTMLRPLTVGWARDKFPILTNLGRPSHGVGAGRGASAGAAWGALQES
jgi:hypothetical protein